MDVDLELEMTISYRELRVLLLCEFRLGRKATEVTSNICRTMGKDALSIRTAQHWFHRFKNGNFKLDDLPHTRSPLYVDMDVLKQLIDDDPRLTTWCLAECSVLFLIIWARKTSTKRTTSKRTSSTSLGKSLKTCTNAGSFLYPSVDDKSQRVVEHTLFKASCIFEVKK